MPWAPPRRGEEAIEWMDAGRGASQEVTQAYAQLAIVNRMLGGFRTTFDALEHALPPSAAPVGKAPPLAILDVAGGAGDFAARLGAWARSRGYAPTVHLLDRNSLALSEADRLDDRTIMPILADALRLPFSPESFDLVHCSTFFHHLSMTHARDALAEMCRVSRRLVVVNDLVRSYVPAATIWLLTRALSRNRLIRHDGPLSVYKAFTWWEMEALSRAVGRDATGFRWRLTRTFPYRMALVGAKVTRPPGPS